MEKYNDIQRTDEEIYRELLTCMTDNENLLADSPERFRAKVISDMTSLVIFAKQDADIRRYFLERGQSPEQALDRIFQRAVDTVAELPRSTKPSRS